MLDDLAPDQGRVQNWYGPWIPTETVEDWDYALPELTVNVDIRP